MLSKLAIEKLLKYCTVMHKQSSHGFDIWCYISQCILCFSLSLWSLVPITSILMHQKFCTLPLLKFNSYSGHSNRKKKLTLTLCIHNWYVSSEIFYKRANLHFLYIDISWFHYSTNGEIVLNHLKDGKTNQQNIIIDPISPYFYSQTR
jgi:hypothetical protein